MRRHRIARASGVSALGAFFLLRPRRQASCVLPKRPARAGRSGRRAAPILVRISNVRPTRRPASLPTCLPTQWTKGGQADAEAQAHAHVRYARRGMQPDALPLEGPSVQTRGSNTCAPQLSLNTPAQRAQGGNNARTGALASTVRLSASRLLFERGQQGEPYRDCTFRRLSTAIHGASVMATHRWLRCEPQRASRFASIWCRRKLLHTHRAVWHHQAPPPSNRRKASRTQRCSGARSSATAHRPPYAAAGAFRPFQRPSEDHSRSVASAEACSESRRSPNVVLAKTSGR